MAIHRIIRINYAVYAILISLLIIASSANFALSPAAADTEAARWQKINIPAEGEPGGWTLAAGSDIRRLVISANGTLYAAVDGLTNTLFRSENGGQRWESVGGVQDDIIDIAVSTRDANRIYYATASAVYRSTNGGRTFFPLPPNPGGAGAGNIEITSLAIAWSNEHIVAAGTRDTDNAEYGGIYLLDEGSIVSEWTDTGAGSYDVYGAAFSPDYAAERQLIAVMTDETDTYAACKIGDTAWNAVIGAARLNRDNSANQTPVAAGGPAAIAFPGNYAADPAGGNGILYIGINAGAGTGDVYKIEWAGSPSASAAADLNAAGSYGHDNRDIGGLAVSGDFPAALLVAGDAASAQTYTSADGGLTWTKTRKEPTGNSITGVSMTPDLADSGAIFTAAGGPGSAVSVTRDSGVTWNQSGLIDTTVTEIIDLAASPDYSSDSTLFLLTFGVGHSLWRSRDGGNAWERALAKDLKGVDTLKLVALPPQYGKDIRTVFLAGESGGNPAVWQSEDDGQNYRLRFTSDPVTGAAFTIDAWAIEDENSFFIGSFDGSHGMVYRTVNGGLFYTQRTAAGSHPLNSLALSPGYKQDGTVLAGNAAGRVFCSRDSGVSFRPVPGDTAAAPFSGAMAVAFDSEFVNNSLIYAASGNANGGIHRFKLEKDKEWKNIDGSLPAGAVINKIASGGAAIYAANSRAGGGVERCLEPTSATPRFETAARGLPAGATLTGLWQNGNRLWTVDTAGDSLMTFLDTLTEPPAPVSPEKDASGAGSLTDHTVRGITIDWETLDGAASYEWQCDYTDDFSAVPASLEDTTTASYARLPALEPATTYYWRVRASAPFLSPWSGKWSFTTGLDTETLSLKPESPAPGERGVPLKPVFQWTAIIGAESYELLVAVESNFTSPSIVRTGEYAIPINVWQCDVSLDYGTTYYWKVRAAGENTRSAWSSAGVFTTLPAPDTDEGLPVLPPVNPLDRIAARTAPAPSLPAPALPAPVEKTPPPEEVVITPSPQGDASMNLPYWAIYMMAGLMAIVFLALVVILAIVLKMKRF